MKIKKSVKGQFGLEYILTHAWMVLTVIIVLSLFFYLFIFNYNSVISIKSSVNNAVEGISGKALFSQEEVEVPSQVSQNSYMEIIINPSSKGIYKFAYIYDSEDNLKQVFSFDCDDVCKERKTARVFINDSYSLGNYVAVFSYESENYIKKDFEVIESDKIEENCVLKRAYWDKEEAKNNQPVALVLESQGCEGKQAVFSIYESDLLSRNFIGNISARINGDVTRVRWNAKWENDALFPSLYKDNPEYVFRVSVNPEIWSYGKLVVYEGEIPSEVYAAVSGGILVHVNTPKFISLGGIDSQGRDSMASSLANNMTFEILTSPGHGKLNGKNLVGVQTAVLTYMPDKDYQGADNFTYRVHDGAWVGQTYIVRMNVAPWTLPIGIPDPGFGIKESYRMYDNPANRNPNLTYTQNSEGGYYTHYIDSSSSNATDTANLYGNPSKPRRTIPFNLPAGSVVEVHSTIVNEHSAISIGGIGSAAMPIFVRGPSMVNRTLMDYMVVGGYENATHIIVENIEALGGVGIVGRQDGTNSTSSDVTINFTNSYITLRNSESHPVGLSAVWAGTSTKNQVHHVVLYNNIVHDTGVWDPLFALGDRDYMGFSVGKISYAWVLDNEMYHAEGDGMQFGYGNDFYVGRNVAHHNKQVGICCKEGENVVLSQNIAYWHRVSSSSEGAGIQFLYSPHNAWVLFNNIYDCNLGIESRSSKDRGVGDVFYLIGNVIHDIHEDPPYNNGTWLAHAITAGGGGGGIEGHILGNTIYDVDNGIGVGAMAISTEIVNNIISDVTLAARYEISLYRSNCSIGGLRNNIFYRGGNPIRISYDSTIYNLSAFKTAFPGVADGSIEANPLFVSTANNNFNLQANSSAIDAGNSELIENISQTFYNLYGIDIRKDIEGRIRPQGNGWDIGAYEYTSGVTEPVCGNNLKETGEVCDGSDLGGESCASRGMKSGTLRCLQGCSGFDAKLCLGPIVIDHTSTNLSKIPQYWLDKAKELTIQYAHRSDGNQLIEGAIFLNSVDPVKYKFLERDVGAGGVAALPIQTSPPGLRLMDGNPPLDAYSVPGLYWQTAAGINATRNNAKTNLFNFSMWSWCDELTSSSWNNASIQPYLVQMDAFEKEFPNMRFIYMTAFVSNTATNVNNNKFVRDYAVANDKVLYDFEDIGKYAPNGTYYSNADRVCTWCIDWCANNPSDCASLPANCAHSSTVPSNKFICVQRGKAFWWMMARLAGWDGMEISLNNPPSKPRYSSFNGNTTSFDSVQDITRVQNAVLEKTSFGKIRFSGAIDFSSLDLDSYVKIEDKKIAINPSEPGMSRLDGPATLTFYNIRHSSPVVKKDGVNCNAPDCTNVSFNAASGILKVDVLGFSNYTIDENSTEPRTIYVDNKLASNCLGNYSIAKRNCSGSDGVAFNTILGASNNVTAGTTVLIRNGTYTGNNHRIIPVKSGVEGSPIIFRDYNNEYVRITGVSGFYVIDINNSKYITVEGLNVDSVSGWGRILDSNHVVIQNNSFKTASTWLCLLIANSTNNKIIGNYLSGGGDNLHLVYSFNNLIEGNRIENASHTLWAVKCGYFNVIRNNYFSNDLEKIGEVFDCNDGTYYTVRHFNVNATKYNLIENNTFAYTPDSYWGIQYAGQNGIIRNNVFYNNTNGGLGMTVYCEEAEYNEHNRVYNNIFYNNGNGGIHYAYSGCRDPPDEVPLWSDAVYTNNILYKNPGPQIFVEGWCDVNCPRMRGFYFENNDILNKSAGERVFAYSSNEMSFNYNLSEVASRYSSLFSSNLEANPGFVDENNKDFRLNSSSQMIDNGAFLTKTIGAGSGTSMRVEDASYFYDGYAIEGEVGDLIQLQGQTGTARVTDINYAINTLTLDRTLTWTNGIGVSLAYSGNKPDIGAYEYTGEIPTARTIYVDNKLASDCIGNYSIAKRNCSGSDGIAYNTFRKAVNNTMAGTTVLIRNGTSNEILNPRVSGTAGNPITFQAYPGETAIITEVGGFSKAEADTQEPSQWGGRFGVYIYNLSYITIKDLTVENIHLWARISQSDHIIIRDCHFYNTTGLGVEASIHLVHSDYNTITNNTLTIGHDDISLIHSDRNLIEGNHIISGRHTLFEIQASNFNVFRNNYFCNDIQKIGDIYDSYTIEPIEYNATRHNLFEGNDFACTSGNDSHGLMAGIQYSAQEGIIRFNVFHDLPQVGLDLEVFPNSAMYVSHNRVYNNVFNNMSFVGIWIQPLASSPYEMEDNIFKSNSLTNSVFEYPTGWPNQYGYSDSWAALVGKPVQFLTARLTSFVCENNNFFRPGDDDYFITNSWPWTYPNPPPRNLSSWQKDYPALFKSNIAADPLYVDSANHDFHLQQNSPLIDAGAFLTQTVGAGSGIVLPVVDARYFFDGFDMTDEDRFPIPGDLIQLQGQTGTARVTDINYAINTLTLDRSLTWSNGQGVSLAYLGSKPDIGAYEFNGEIPAKEDNNFSFMFIGDDNGDSAQLAIRFAYQNYPNLAAVFSIPDNGWQTRNATYLRYRNEWLRLTNSTSNLAPIFMGLGNHDIEVPDNVDFQVKSYGPTISSSLPGMKNFKEGPYDTYTQHGNYQDRFLQYSFDYKNAHFIVLNPYFHDVLINLSSIGDQCGAGSSVNRFDAGYGPMGCVSDDMLNWLEEDLRSTNATFKFMFYHEGAQPVPGGRHTGDSLDCIYCPGNTPTGARWWENESRPMRDKFWDLLAKYNMTANFVGHAHHSTVTWANDFYGKYGALYEIEPGEPTKTAIVNINGDDATLRMYDNTYSEIFGPIKLSEDKDINYAPKLYPHDAGNEQGFPPIEKGNYVLEVDQSLSGYTSLYFEAKDNDVDDKLTFSFNNLPYFLNITDWSSQLRRISLRTDTSDSQNRLTVSDIGNYSFDVIVNDSRATDKININLSVLPVGKPVLLGASIPNNSVINFPTNGGYIYFLCRDNESGPYAPRYSGYYVKYNGTQVNCCSMWHSYATRGLTDNLASSQFIFVDDWDGIDDVLPGRYDITVSCSDAAGHGSDNFSLSVFVSNDSSDYAGVYGSWPNDGASVNELTRMSFWAEGSIAGLSLNQLRSVIQVRRNSKVFSDYYIVSSSYNGTLPWGNVDIIFNSPQESGIYEFNISGEIFTVTVGKIENVIYVDNKLASDCIGNYSIAKRNCSGSDGIAYKTIEKAANISTAGTTVLIRNGTYAEYIMPNNSGVQGNPITFMNFGNETVVITGKGIWPNYFCDKDTYPEGFLICSKSYITIHGLNFNFTNMISWGKAFSSDNIIISDNRFMNAGSGGFTRSIGFISSRNISIINNVLINGSDNIVLVNTTNTLIEGNNVTIGSHSLFSINCGSYNIIRNNYFYNEIQKIGEMIDCNISDPDHGPSIYYGIYYDNSTQHNLIENNTFAYTAPGSSYSGIQYAGQNGIIRNNLFYNCNGAGIQIASYPDEAKYNLHNRVYNNVFYNNTAGAVETGYSFAGSYIADNIFKNNILYKGYPAPRAWQDYCLGGSMITHHSTMANFLFERNNIINNIAGESTAILYRYNRTMNLSTAQTNYPSLYVNNIEVNPGFVDAESYNFKLNSSSQMINAGAFLTQTVGAGSDTVLPVVDARYFFDGYGMNDENGLPIPGDVIQLQADTRTARIVSVDYATNTLTLDRALSWANGTGVSLAYLGSKPDIGAYEYLITPCQDYVKSVESHECINSMCVNDKLVFITNNSFCNDNDNCTLDACTRDGCQHKFDLSRTECLNLIKNCEDKDNDGVLDYDPAKNCTIGKDRCIRQKANLTSAEMNSLQPRATWFNITFSGTDMRNISEFKIYKENIAEIKFKQMLDLVRLNESGCFDAVNIDPLVEIYNRKVKIYSEDFSELNKPAIITFYNASFLSPKINKDGAECSDCKIVSYDSKSQILVVEVSGFSEYEVVEGYSGGNGNGGNNGGGGGAGSEIPTKLCNESWSCGEWSVCENGAQTRICIDKNDCRIAINKPETTRSCEVEKPFIEQAQNQIGDIIKTIKLNAKLIIFVFVFVFIMAAVILFIIFQVRSRAIEKRIQRRYIAGKAERIVEEARRRGYSDSQIVGMFRNKGWKDSDINKLMK